VDASDKPNPAAHSKKQIISHVIQADGTQSAPVLGKRKLDAAFETEASKTASKNPGKANSDTTDRQALIGNPMGLRWSNNSCAFDAVLTFLYNVWLDNTTDRSRLGFKTLHTPWRESVTPCAGVWKERIPQLSLGADILEYNMFWTTC